MHLEISLRWKSIGIVNLVNTALQYASQIWANLTWLKLEMCVLRLSQSFVPALIASKKTSLQKWSKLTQNKSSHFINLYSHFEKTIFGIMNWNWTYLQMTYPPFIVNFDVKVQIWWLSPFSVSLFECRYHSRNTNFDFFVWA